MSFVDMMGNERWSNADISRRTEAMVRSEFSAEAEQILNRKVTGQVLGAYTMTTEEQAELARFQAVIETARTEGDVARADAALLNATLDYEAAQVRLAQPVPDVPTQVEQLQPDGSVVMVDNPVLVADAAGRAAAQAVVNAASQVVQGLAAMRASGV